MASEKITISNEDLLDIPEPNAINIDLLDLPPDDSGSRMYPGINGTIPSMNSKSGSIIVRSNILQSVIAGLLGGFFGWVLMEVLDRNLPYDGTFWDIVLSSALSFCVVGAMIGLFLGAGEGVFTRTWPKVLRGGAIGFSFGFLGGLTGGGIGQVIYSFFGGGMEEDFVLQILIRAVGWGILGLIVGLGQGVSNKSWKKTVNGLLGGLIGGLIGGGLFDIIGALTGGDTISRMLAVTLLGAFTGGAIGLVDEMRKEAWLQVVSGPLAGKEFILFNESTLIGGAPKCGIVLYKDPKVAAVHATINSEGKHYRITDNNTVFGTYIDEMRINSSILRSGQQIRCGATLFSFCLKDVR